MVLEEPGVEPISLMKSLKASLHSVDIQKFPTVQNNIRKISKHTTIILDIIGYMKCQLRQRYTHPYTISC
jgi:hypothetical protein